MKFSINDKVAFARAVVRRVGHDKATANLTKILANGVIYDH